MSSSNPILKFTGHAHLRQRLVMAALSGRIVRIDKIRSQADNPGLVDFEASFLRLLEKITNGSTIEIGYTGTSVLFKPGVLVGGKIRHECPTSRSVGYYLEALAALAPFCKKPLVAWLTGITSNNIDLSVDTLRTVTLPLLKSFGIDEGIELRITKRGSVPDGGGEVQFICPVVRAVKPVMLVDEGRIKRIRGIAHSTRVSPDLANRAVSSVRSVVNRYIPDVFIYTDTYKGAEAGKSPGYGVTLVAESTTGVLLSAERIATAGETPENLGKLIAKQLLDEVRKGGCFDSNHQWLPLLLMTISPEDVSKIRLGKLTEFTMQYLRDLRDFFGITFKIKPDTHTKTILLTCVGTGFLNVNRKTT